MSDESVVFDRYKNNLDADCFKASSIDSDDSDVLLPKHKEKTMISSDSEEEIKVTKLCTATGDRSSKI